jgi:hypothetical protein
MSNLTIPQLFSKSYEQLLIENSVVLAVANTSFSKELKEAGDTITVQTGFQPTLRKWSGGDLGTREKMDTSSVDIVINDGDEFHFEITAKEKQQVIASERLCGDSVNNAIKAIALNIDAALCNLYDGAKYNYNEDYNSNATLTLTSTNIFEMFSNARLTMNKGNVPKMDRVAIVPPEITALLDVYLSKSGNTINPEYLKIFGNGYVGRVAGFALIESNQVYNANNKYYPLFTVKERALAAAIPVPPENSIEEYTPENSLGRAYKGGVLYGVKEYRPDMLLTGEFEFDLTA